MQHRNFTCMKRNILTLTIIVLVFTQVAFCQRSETRHGVEIQIPEVALLGVIAESNNGFNVAQNSAVSFLNSETFESKVWINYSSIVSKNKKRKLIAMVDRQLPQGIKIKLCASEATGLPKGNVGKTTGEVQLTSNPTDVLTGIGSCYTGAGVNNGHSLSCKVETDTELDQNQLLAFSNETYNIIFTLTDSN